MCVIHKCSLQQNCFVQMAVEVKQGISQLELLYEELTREEIAKQQRREKLRLKRKKKKERRYETEEKENSCDVRCKCTRVIYFFSKYITFFLPHHNQNIWV